MLIFFWILIVPALAQEIDFEILPRTGSEDMKMTWSTPLRGHLDMRADPPQARVHVKGQWLHPDWGLVVEGRKVEVRSDGAVEFDVVVHGSPEDIALQSVNPEGKIRTHTVQISSRNWSAAMERAKNPYYQRPYRLLRWSVQAVGGAQISGEGLGISGQLGWQPVLKLTPHLGARLNLVGALYRARETRSLFPALEYEIQGAVWFKQFELDLGAGAQTWFGYSTFPQVSLTLRREFPEFCPLLCAWARSGWIAGQWSPYQGDHILWLKAGVELGR